MRSLQRLLPEVGDIMLNRYELQEELGRGGFGVVFKGRQTTLDKPVAIKILLPHILSHDDLVDRFVREVEVAKDLQHPNTIRIMDYGKTDMGIPFYVMEYANGRSLGDIIKQDGPLDDERTRHITIQLLKSLAEAHAKGVVHRDLKPANLMICDVYGERDFVKVLDFGIAKALTDQTSTTKTGMLLGSPPYMSPEQCQGKKDLDHRSDLYSVALIIGECLMGKPVLPGETLPQVLAQHFSQEPLPFSDRVKSSPLWPVIKIASAKNRDERFPDATAMRVALEQVDMSGARTPASDGASAAGQSHEPVHYGSTQPYPTPPSPGVGHTPLPVAARQIAMAKTLHKPSDEAVASPPGVNRGLVAIALGLLIVGAAVAGIMLASRDNSVGPDPEPPETRMSYNDQVPIPPDQQQTHPPTDDDTVVVTDDDTVTPPPDDHTVAILTNDDHPLNPIDPQGEDLRLTFGVVDAQTLVHGASPQAHRIEVRGTDGMTVLLGERVLGETPFELTVPRLDHRLSFEFRRSGYVTERHDVNLAQDEPVSVRLRREQSDSTHTVTTVQNEGDDDDDDDDTPLVIPEVPIH